MKIKLFTFLAIMICVFSGVAKEKQMNAAVISSSSTADLGVINKERILYWLEKRGELSSNASEKQKQNAVNNTLAKNHLKPKNYLVNLVGKFD